MIRIRGLEKNILGEIVCYGKLNVYLYPSLNKNLAKINSPL